MARRKTSLIALREISEINMTPLMDLTFILLITFIITFPLIEQGVQVNLPAGKADPLNTEARTVTIDKTGKLFLDDLPVSRDELIREMELISRLSDERTVYVRADKQVAYEKVADIVVVLKTAGIKTMGLVTEE